MSAPHEFILGEFSRLLDERFRLSIPAELADRLAAAGTECILVKERPGCLSLWPASAWQQKIDAEMAIVEGKIRAGKLAGRLAEVQTLGRLLSTRHTPVQLAGRGRLLIPEGFREFLQVAAGGEVIVVGAAVCLEIWRPAAWLAYLDEKIPEFGQLVEQLSA
jgi:MraZ protein